MNRSFHPMLKALLATLLLSWIGNQAIAADPCNLDQACEIEGGDYYLALPDGWNDGSPRPAVVFFHGHNSSGKSVIRSEGIMRAFVDQGYILIAPNGDRRARDGVRAWPARPMGDTWRNDIGFTLAVIEDAAQKVPISRKDVLVSGFSAGGSMAWMVACYEGEHFAGYVSIAGALRRPIPDSTCPAGPIRMLHIHGFADRQVPLEGRAIGDWHQGDVHQSLELLRQTNQCSSTPNEISINEAFRCRTWSTCGSGQDVQLCMHDGGHGFPKGWGELARSWFERSSGAESNRE